eukprot:COSAG04_NODE_15182_length_540_cov_1.907029_1_plen_101_part_00
MTPDPEEREPALGAAAPPPRTAAPTDESTAGTGRPSEPAAEEGAAPECSICLADVLPTDARSIAHPESGCTHTFHWRCLALALEVSPTCPNCRASYGSLL